MSTFSIEITDTFGGEANYSWVRRHLVRARSFRGAAAVVSRREGFRTRQAWNTGDYARYDVQGACVCVYITAVEV